MESLALSQMPAGFSQLNLFDSIAEEAQKPVIAAPEPAAAPVPRATAAPSARAVRIRPQVASNEKVQVNGTVNNLYVRLPKPFHHDAWGEAREALSDEGCRFDAYDQKHRVPKDSLSNVAKAIDSNVQDPIRRSQILNALGAQEGVHF